MRNIIADLAHRNHQGLDLIEKGIEKPRQIAKIIPLRINGDAAGEIIIGNEVMGCDGNAVDTADHKKTDTETDQHNRQHQHHDHQTQIFEPLIAGRQITNVSRHQNPVIIGQSIDFGGKLPLALITLQREM